MATRITALEGILVAAGVAVSRVALGGTYDCNAVDARATVHARGTVTMAEDEGAKTCTFSVDGATSSTFSSSSAADAARPLDAESYLKAYSEMRRGVPEPSVSLIPDLLVAAGENGFVGLRRFLLSA